MKVLRVISTGMMSVVLGLMLTATSANADTTTTVKKVVKTSPQTRTVKRVVRKQVPAKTVKRKTFRQSFWEAFRGKKQQQAKRKMPVQKKRAIKKRVVKKQVVKKKVVRQPVRMAKPKPHPLGAPLGKIPTFVNSNTWNVLDKSAVVREEKRLDSDLYKTKKKKVVKRVAKKRPVKRYTPSQQHAKKRKPIAMVAKKKYSPSQVKKKHAAKKANVAKGKRLVQRTQQRMVTKKVNRANAKRTVVKKKTVVKAKPVKRQGFFSQFRKSYQAARAKRAKARAAAKAATK